MDLFSSTTERTEETEKEWGLEDVGVCVLERGKKIRSTYTLLCEEMWP